MRTAKKLGACFLVFAVLFVFAWVLDPNSALMQQTSTVQRAGTFIAYLGAIWVTWLAYQPKE